MPIGTSFFTEAEEIKIAEAWINGEKTIDLMRRYGFKTDKSIIDKIKKHGYWTEENIKKHKDLSHNYVYKLNSIENEFDAYFLGLMMTDGWITMRKDKNGGIAGLGLADKDCIEFLAERIKLKVQIVDRIGDTSIIDGQTATGRKLSYRICSCDQDLISNLQKYGVIERKSKILSPPLLSATEEKYYPYLIRGIIDGDGTVHDTTYGKPLFSVFTASKDFKNFLLYVLENKMYMKDIFVEERKNAYWVLTTAHTYNINILKALSYNKPFGMARNYNNLHQISNQQEASETIIESGIVNQS